MKRAIIILVSTLALIGVAHFTLSKWAIKHETISFYDASRDNRPVPVDIAVRLDREMQANAGLIILPVAVLNHGNTVKNTGYSFLADFFAARGYLVISPQHDLPTDPPMVTKPGQPYDGRLPQLRRGVANVNCILREMKNVQPNADYEHLTMVGHSMGGDIVMYFAWQYPDKVQKVVTLDNLRVPIIVTGKFKTLTFRSRDPQFKADPGVVPSERDAEKEGVTVLNTPFHHNDMRDSGPDDAKGLIKGELDEFLDRTDGKAAPVEGQHLEDHKR